MKTSPSIYYITVGLFNSSVVILVAMTDVNATETTMQGVKLPVCKALAMQAQRKPVCYFENVCCPNNMVYLAPDCMGRYFPNNTICTQQQ